MAEKAKTKPTRPKHDTTFTSPHFSIREVICSTKGCTNHVVQWGPTRWGWLNRCHKCAAADFAVGRRWGTPPKESK